VAYILLFLPFLWARCTMCFFSWPFVHPSVHSLVSVWRTRYVENEWSNFAAN